MKPGEIIGALVDKSGTNLRQLAIKADIPYNTLYAIVKRKSERIEPTTLQRIAAALDVPVGQLLSIADQEPDRDFEIVCDTLDTAGLCLEAVGLGDGTGADGDFYYVWHKDAETPAEDRVQYAFRDLLRIATEVQKAAELKKHDYIRKRMEADLF